MMNCVKVMKLTLQTTKCNSVGKLAQQSWSLDTSVQPQQMNLTFLGGDFTSTSTIVVTCDENIVYPSIKALDQVPPGSSSYVSASKKRRNLPGNEF